MLNKVAFLCADPWESFLPAVSQSYSKSYYQWVRELAVLKSVKLCCREYIETYGAFDENAECSLFLDNSDRLQLLYVQSARRELLENIFRTADLVIMGIPGSRKEFDKIYMSVFPWKDKILFLWGEHISRDLQYVYRLMRECMLRKEQLLEIGKGNSRNFGIKKAPVFVREP